MVVFELLLCSEDGGVFRLIMEESLRDGLMVCWKVNLGFAVV